MGHRYKNRSAKAIDVLGGGERIMREMKVREYCTNPRRTFETWLERRDINPNGMVLLWQIAFDNQIAITPYDFEVIDRQ